MTREIEELDTTGGTPTSKDDGLAVRDDVLRFLTGHDATEAIREIKASDQACLVVAGAVPARTVARVRSDMIADPGWRREYWILDEHDEARPVDSDCFHATPGPRRFSHNLCLRKPHPHAYALRGLLLAVTSHRTLAAVSAAYGEPLRFTSADVATYVRGDYLRRHSDTFADRRLSLVWFVTDPPPPDSGGELVVEAPTGESLVVPPRGGSVAVVRLQPEYSHLVAAVRSPTWRRYSIATHYSGVER